VKVGGKWAYLYRAVDKHGDTIDFYLSPTRNAQAAKRFLSKSLTGLKAWEKPLVINTDKAPTYAAAIAELKREGKCPKETEHRQVKYLNNVVEADHGKLKQLIRPVRGHEGAAQGAGGDLQPHARHARRGPYCRARFWNRLLRSCRGNAIRQ
jgi:transposase-like protein